MKQTGGLPALLTAQKALREGSVRSASQYGQRSVGHLLAGGPSKNTYSFADGGSVLDQVKAILGDTFGGQADDVPAEQQTMPDVSATPDAIMQVETDNGTFPFRNALHHDAPIGPAQIRPSTARALGIPIEHLTDPKQLPQVIQHLLDYNRYQLANDLQQAKGLSPDDARAAAEPYAVAAYNIGPSATRAGMGMRRDQTGHTQPIPVDPGALARLQRGMAYWGKTQQAKQGIPPGEWRDQ